MAAPITVGVGLIVATIAWFFVVRGTSGEAHGGEAVLRFSSTCADEARPVMLARLEEYGLKGSFAPDSFTLTTQMPGMPDDLAHMPVALTAPGTFEVKVDGATKTTTFQNVGVQIAFSGAPITLVTLPEAIPDHGVEVYLDGKKVELESSESGVELQIPSRAKDSRSALRAATDRVVALRHPLPCPVTPEGAEWAGK